MDNSSDKFRWWLIVCFQVLIFSLAWFLGIWTSIWDVDLTKLSFVILLVWFITTLLVGVQHFNYNRRKALRFLSVGWFLSEVCLSLGILGTVGGFLIMLVTAFTDIDVSNTQTLQDALSNMALGMGTALYTTMTGLVCSLFIKSQLVNLEDKAG